MIDEKLKLSEVVKLQYEFAGPRGLLQLLDHRASAIEDREFVPNHQLFAYQFPHPEKRNVQKLIEKYWQDDLLLIRAPTGAGKTDASLLWASKQIENSRADRLVIAMPTRFTSNALAINVSESLSDTGLYHSSAWFNQFQEGVESGKIKRKEANKIHEFARLLQTPVTVCTIDHLLMSLTLTREDHHLITFNLANSCLVIDEADFYDDFTQANILVLLEILRHWKVPINWLITSKQISQKGDTNTNFWKSRNIPAQETVFVRMPKSTYYNNYLAFQSSKLEYSVELPLYLIEKGKKNHTIDLKTIHIKEESENIYVIRDGFYSFKKGVYLNLEDSFL